MQGCFFSRADKSPLTYILDPDIEEDYDCLGDFDDIDCEVIPKTVGQYTGIDDVNGDKIFEGDIVKHLISGYEDGGGEVYYQEGAFGTQARLMSDFPTFTLVVGNVHDNPELLEEKK